MKKYLFIYLILIVTAFSCGKTKFEDGKYTLKIDGCFSENNQGVQICFKRLITDSRCPKGGVCVWQGVASGEFLFTDGQQSVVFTLSTLNNSVFHKDTTINNIKISLIDITPYPDFPNSNSSAPKAIIEIK